MKLNELSVGKSARVLSVGGSGALRQHFLDMGLIPGANLTFIKLAPMKDPLEIKIHGYELTLRVDDAKLIEVEQIESLEEEEVKPLMNKKIHHPGLGQGGIYHSKEHSDKKIEGLIKFALVGNQNCGKTTLFNQLTGSNQHVGNFPGVTVDKKSGQIRNYPNTQVTDLPGIYSLSPYSNEEIVSRNFILDEKPECIINIVDGNNIERNLYLTLQLMNLNIPMVLAINMMDELTGNGGAIDVNRLEALLGIPVVPISAAKNEGVDELIEHAMHIAMYQEKPEYVDFCDKNRNNGAVHRAVHSIMHLIEDHAESVNIPKRFAASKLIEQDSLTEDALNLTLNEKELLEHIIIQMEEESGLDRNAAIADERFAFIKEVCKQAVKKPKKSKEYERSQKIDKILTGRFTAIPVFVLIMGLIFFLTFNVIGALLQDLLAFLIDKLTVAVDLALTSLQVDEIVHSLVIEGIFEGLGSVVSFLPIIVVLFFFLSLLEDTGYMARIAFVMDKLLRKLGLSGRSIVPLLIGFGCTVPGVMSTRTLSSERDRKMTIMLTPFMSCTAKLPIYALFTKLFFPKIGWIVMVMLYFIGILVGVLVALVSKNTIFKGEAVPFVMELPNYRLPTAKNVMHLLWEKAKDFLSKAFSIILVATIIVWILQSFNFRLNFVEDSSKSMLAVISGFISPIFKPVGFADWRVVTSLISGFMAKESVVSTITVLFGSTEAIELSFSALQILSLLVFCLLYTPCVASIATVRKELGVKWSIIMVLSQCGIAYLVALLIYQVGSII